MKITHLATRLLSALVGTGFTPLMACVLTSVAAAHSGFYFTATLDSGQVVPPSGSAANGSARVVYTFDPTYGYRVRYDIEVLGLAGTHTGTKIHGYAAAGSNAPVVYTLPVGAHVSGGFVGAQNDLSQWLTNSAYISIESSAFPGGELRGQLIWTATPPEILFCTGEGLAPCPCGNNSLPGIISGCQSSLGWGASLNAHQIASLSCDTLKVHSLQLPPTTSVLFFQGTTMVNGGFGAAFGDGLRCVSGTVIRLGTKTASSGQCFYPGDGDIPIATKGNITTVGTVSYYQAWYRNAVTFCTPSTFNLTNGTSATWVP